jgi:hypothetical protein
MGESVVNTGAFHEALNMAGLWKLPVVYVIENNRYGMGTALERASAIHDIYERGASYNIPRAVCDGQDVFAVRAAMQEAVDRARGESEPTLLEVRTYRFMGHSMSDAVSGTYRTKAELDEYMKRDPIVLLRMHMHEQGELSDDDLHKLDEEIKAIAQDAWDFADKSPEPPLEALYEDVLVDTTSDATAMVAGCTRVARASVTSPPPGRPEIGASSSGGPSTATDSGSVASATRAGAGWHSPSATGARSGSLPARVTAVKPSQSRRRISDALAPLSTAPSNPVCKNEPSLS